jgi:hypothetical protein
LPPSQNLMFPELAAGEAVAGLAVAQGVAEHDVVGLLVLDEHVRAADRPALVVVLLAEQGEVGPRVSGADRLLANRQHAAGAAGRIVDLAVDAGLIDVLLAGVDKMGHQSDHLARGEVVARLLVRLPVEAHETLERIGRVQLGTMGGRQGHAGEYVGLGLIEEARELRRFGAHLIGNTGPLSFASFSVILHERGRDVGRCYRHVQGRCA